MPTNLYRTKSQCPKPDSNTSKFHLNKLSSFHLVTKRTNPLSTSSYTYATITFSKTTTHITPKTLIKICTNHLLLYKTNAQSQIPMLQISTTKRANPFINPPLRKRNPEIFPKPKPITYLKLFYKFARTTLYYAKTTPKNRVQPFKHPPRNTQTFLSIPPYINATQTFCQNHTLYHIPTYLL